MITNRKGDKKEEVPKEAIKEVEGISRQCCIKG